MADSIVLNYKDASCDLCDIGKKYDTDKTSYKRAGHTHAYTLVYNDLFKSKRNKPVSIAELGILDGASLLMWNEYFTNPTIHGFEYNPALIDKFKRYNLPHIQLYPINITDPQNVKQSFHDASATYDIIIDDTTHQFPDQLNVIRNAYQYLNPGGILIIEDIFKKYNENDYLVALSEVLPNFQEYYFVSVEHKNRNSVGWDNDKLFILVKHGEPQFPSLRTISIPGCKLSIITPCYRQQNLSKMFNSIRFDLIDKWYIIYDTSKGMVYTKQYVGHPKIEELECSGGISGNPQRNLGVTQVHDGFIYFLDDDNIVHPEFWSILPTAVPDRFYTWDQARDSNGRVLKGAECKLGRIDTAMFMIPRDMMTGLKWTEARYDADGLIIEDIYRVYSDKHVYIPRILAYYNKLV